MDLAEGVRQGWTASLKLLFNFSGATSDSEPAGD
jgi:hypothetical protein